MPPTTNLPPVTTTSVGDHLSRVHVEGAGAGMTALRATAHLATGERYTATVWLTDVQRADLIRALGGLVPGEG